MAVNTEDKRKKQLLELAGTAQQKGAAADGQRGDTYQSPWQSQINDTLDKIVKRQPFSYDVNADALYKQLSEQYQAAGKRAMEDSVGKITALTGGYGNSYAASAGQQAYNAHMEGLKDITPQLYQLAMSKYQMEGDELTQQLGLLMQQEGAAYDRYLADRQWQYQVGRDQLADQRYDREFAYQQDQDKLAQQNWQQQFDYGKQQDALAQQNWLQQFQYGKEQDAIANQQWDKQFAEAQRQWNAQHGGSGGGTSSSGTVLTGSGGGSAYAGNEGLGEDQIKEMQHFFGADPDGKWGPNSRKAAGGLSAEDAWEKYQSESGGGSGGEIEPVSSNKTKEFINKHYTSANLPVGGQIAYNRKVLAAIEQEMKNGLSESEAVYLMDYYNLWDMV